MLTREDKEQIVADLVDRFQRQAATVIVDIEGMSIQEQHDLRSRLRDQHLEMLVVRKTLVDRALEQAGITLSIVEYKKPLAFVFGYDDVVLPAKTVKTFFKEFERPVIVSGVLGTTPSSVDEMNALADLPGREELNAKIFGSLAAPMRGLGGVLQGTLRGLFIVLQQRAKQQS